jgi:hypothetical protein
MTSGQRAGDTDMSGASGHPEPGTASRPAVVPAAALGSLVRGEPDTHVRVRAQRSEGVDTAGMRAHEVRLVPLEDWAGNDGMAVQGVDVGVPEHKRVEKMEQEHWGCCLLSGTAALSNCGGVWACAFLGAVAGLAWTVEGCPGSGPGQSAPCGPAPVEDIDLPIAWPVHNYMTARTRGRMAMAWQPMAEPLPKAASL